MPVNHIFGGKINNPAFQRSLVFNGMIRKIGQGNICAKHRAGRERNALDCTCCICIECDGMVFRWIIPNFLNGSSCGGYLEKHILSFCIACWDIFLMQNVSAAGSQARNGMCAFILFNGPVPTVIFLFSRTLPCSV